MSKVVFSGIQPSGNLHIGNYIGAVRQWVSGQNNGLNIFCIVDLHAITVPQEPIELSKKTREITAILLAAGIDPNKSILFVQSHNPDHANLGWVLNCYLSMGQLNRMTQFKDKSEGRDFVSVGLFDYPALMAADILLYDTTDVPVGDDQKQHVELARDVAEKFNNKYDQTFVLPEPVIPKVGGRIMSLTNPAKKMSKSDSDPNGAIGLLENPESARKKIMTAVTDSNGAIGYDSDSRPGISNLMNIYSGMTGVNIDDVKKQFIGFTYSALKDAVANSVETTLKSLQERYKELNETNELERILKDGVEKSYEMSHKKLMEVYQKVGFI